MQRLTLILSDLYLPEEEAGESAPPGALALAHFEALLRISATEHVGDWRRWLVRELGVAALADIPVAEVAGRAFLSRDEHEGTWMATPVSLSARLDHVRLDERGLLRVDPDEGALWHMEFASHFAPRFGLHPAGGRGFLLTGLNPAAAITLDPARLLGADIGESLPRGSGSADLRRLGSEVEMWLHDSPLNALRASAGKPRISTLWFWGGGARAPDPLLQEIPSHSGALQLHGMDPFLAGLAVVTANKLASPPVEFAQLDAGAGHHVVELSPMTGGADESLAVLDAKWFAAARKALVEGALSELAVVANDRCFRISSRAHWRFWRRRRGWIANLGFPNRSQKA